MEKEPGQSCDCERHGGAQLGPQYANLCRVAAAVPAHLVQDLKEGGVDME